MSPWYSQNSLMFYDARCLGVLRKGQYVCVVMTLEEWLCGYNLLMRETHQD
jgi:hypothetical protein